MTTNRKFDSESNNTKSEQQVTEQVTKNETNKPTGGMLSGWSRQQKFALVACSALLGSLLAVSAFSKQPAKTALVGVSGGGSIGASGAAQTASTSAVPSVVMDAASAEPAPVKKALRKKRPANVTYSDTNSGVSFLYPRKFAVTSGNKAQVELDAVGDTPMNFVQPGGVAVATVALPAESYPGTDFASAFFNVNVNRNVSEEECTHFAFVDTRNADDEPVDAEKIKVGTTDMEMTSDFSASATKQDETQYYHNYESGACYEYVLGLGTAGYGIKDGIEPVDRDAVFARLGKILTTVKIKPVVTEHPAEEESASIGGSRE